MQIYRFALETNDHYNNHLSHSSSFTDAEGSPDAAKVKTTPAPQQIPDTASTKQSSRSFTGFCAECYVDIEGKILFMYASA